MRVGEGKGGKEDAHSGVNEVSRDLRHKVMKRSHEICEEREEIEEIELSLGLSMNGRFGIDPTQKKLRRSSSVSNVVFAADNSVGNGSHTQARVGAFGSYAPLVRASSMPEWRRQGEFQAAANLENGKCPDGDGLHVDANGTHDLRSQLVKESNQNQTLQNSSSLPFLRKPIRERPNMDGSEKGKGSPRNTLTDMPYVSTRGVEPNHKKIEGFLYRYRRGEEVKIVCVCHGMFLSPAEFVKHGGGGDVAHPLKHIVVNPFPLY